MFSKIAGVVAAGLIALGGVVMTAAPASAAETNPHCAGSVPIGSTGYITHNGVNIGSVKQFKGCNKNWAYTYVWESFRSSHSSWQLCAAVAKEVPGNDQLVDLQCDYKRAEVWSSGASTLSNCTHAVGNIEWGSTSRSGRSSTRC